MQLNDLPSPRLLEISGRCVACGLCLPHCPTYRKTQSEADSPRGRIMLMRGVLERRIPANARFFQHIDACLTCRACERACPNGVAYGALVDGVRAEFAGLRGGAERMGGGGLTHPSPSGRGGRGEGAAWGKRLRRSLLMRALTRPALLARLAPLLRLARRLGARALPEVSRTHPWKEVYSAQGVARGGVALFLGCVARLTDAATLDAAIHVLSQLGYTVRVPRTQTCCGALHRHEGDAATARRLETANLAAFAGADAVISCVSGCGAQLADRGRVPVQDISAFLDTASGWENVTIAPLPQAVAVHDPCTLRNVQRAAAAPYRLLQRIPQLRIEALPGNDQCCGAAGTYFLDQPGMARALRDDKMAALRICGAKYLATSNVGCAMYLADGLRAEGIEIEVLHPVVLLARQMGYEGNA
ncbi:MAG: (Fe-S)-binding protein [Pseudomonadota bacterium]